MNISCIFHRPLENELFNILMHIIAKVLTLIKGQICRFLTKISFANRFSGPSSLTRLSFKKTKGFFNIS